MARPLRIEFPGAVYHVTSRGNARAAIYSDDTDRTTFLVLLTQVIQRSHWLCHAYCLMDHHYHLVLETPEGNLARGMRQINGLYTQWYNRRHGRVGHVLQGRYKAILIERDSYLLTVCRSVVLNPVRASMVPTAQEYHWSSDGATAGDCEPPALLCTDWLLAQCGHDRVAAQQHYRGFVAEGIAQPSPWQALSGQLFLGHAPFVEAMRPRLQAARTLPDISRIQRYADRPDLAVLLRGHQTMSPTERNHRIALAHLDYGYTLTAIGSVLGLHYTTISKVVKAQWSDIARPDPIEVR